MDGHRKKKRSFRPITRTADVPGQTVNIDLCFVPTTRTADQAIPAVSGSSGRLIVTTPPAARSTTFPGAVFATPDQPYAEQMQAYTAAANHRYGWRSKPTTVPDPIRQQRIELRHHATLLQAARRTMRLQRAEEDRAWMQGLNARPPETWQRTYVRIPTMAIPLINRVVFFAATRGSRHHRWHQRASEGAAAGLLVRPMLNV